jgi:hypothetical protein
MLDQFAGHIAERLVLAGDFAFAATFQQHSDDGELRL